MVSTCFYFQVHQPFRLNKYKIFDIGKGRSYFDDKKNEEILRRVCEKCYIPANNKILDLIRKHDDKFKVSYSITGTLLEQLEQHSPKTLESFRDLTDTGSVEMLSETYYHSLSFLFSKKEFKKQILKHKRTTRQLFRQSPKVMRNTELIYNNEVAKIAESMGYKAVLMEGADSILEWRSPNFVYSPVNSKMKLLLKNYRLSDDIAFRFSESSWNEYPLTAEKFALWISNFNGNGNLVNLFMDYETFGEHQWESTGIFKFLEKLPEEILKNPDNEFVTPSEALKYDSVGELDIPNPVSWADIERDVSAWIGNKMQVSAIRELYRIEKEIIKSKNQDLIEKWRKLQTSDHFYYMCTKYFADGDVHKYFNPYDEPYDAFITFMNILADMKMQLRKKTMISFA